MKNMFPVCELQTTGLLEKDNNGDILWTWSYPSMSGDQRDLFARKADLSVADVEDAAHFVYGQWNRSWYYIRTTIVEHAVSLPKTCLILPSLELISDTVRKLRADGDITRSKVSAFALVIVSREFNPEKYASLMGLLSKQYQHSGSPADLLKIYLAVLTKGLCNGDENGTFNSRDFDLQKSCVNAPIQNVITLFGIESILIYTAVLLKKRVVVYHPRLEHLLHIIRAFPAFVWHRQNWAIFHPYVHMIDSELASLQHSSCYIAGFTDAAIETRHEYYDVFVNIAAPQITVASHAKESLTLGKLHKDLATVMVHSAETSDNEQIIKDLTHKTRELLNNLKSLATEDDDGNSYITLDALRQRKMPVATQTFLYNLAACEGFIKL